jgi:hypothetical protein
MYTSRKRFQIVIVLFISSVFLGLLSQFKALSILTLFVAISIINIKFTLYILISIMLIDWGDVFHLRYYVQWKGALIEIVDTFITIGFPSFPALFLFISNRY